MRYDGKPVYEGGWEVGNLIIPPNHLGDSTRLTITQYGNPDSDMWHIWSIQAHTHELGKDYNVWLRNPDGSKGDHLYNGKSNATHTFQTGFYDWEHPPLRIFNPMYPVDMSVGLIHEAVFHNDRPDTAGFGLRTIDEMFVTYIFYAKSAPVGIIPGKTFNEAHVRIFPNPVSHEAFIQISPDMPLKNAELRIYDSIGKEVSVLKNITERQLSMNFSGLPRGNFFYRLISDGQSAASGKFVIAR